MTFKPGDLFFTAVEFFSVIVPGTMALGLMWDRAQLAKLVPIVESASAEVVAFLVIAYLFGQALTALASWLDKLYDKWRVPKKKRQRNDQLASDVRQIVAAKLGVAVPEQESILVWTDAFLRSAKDIDASHIEYLEAESKFFRSVLLVLPMYVALFVVKSQLWLAGLTAILIPLAIWRYMDRRVTRTMETYRTFIAAEALGKIARQAHRYPVRRARSESVE